MSGAARLLVVDLRADRMVVADVGVEGADVRLHCVQRHPRGADLATDLRAATRALGRRAPRRAVCLSEQVTAVCLDLPPAEGLTPDRLEGLVRWELEPFLATDAGAPLACGWSSVPGPGPVFAAAIPLEQRDDLTEAFTAAGLRLETIYPSGAGAAAIAANEPHTQQILEAESDRIAVSHVEAGRVTRFQLLPCSVGEAPELLSSLRDSQDEAAEPFEPEGDPIPASVHGVARHALGLEGGERLPGIAARAPRAPLLQRFHTHAGLLVAIALLLVIGADLGVAHELRAAERRAATARAALTKVEQARDRQLGLATLRAQLEARQTTAEREQRVLAACAQRQAYLPALLRALAASLPDDLALDEIREDPDTSLWIEGFALSDLDTKTFLRDLTERLRPLGLIAREPVVRRRKGRFGVEGYQFVLRFRLREEQ